MLRAGVGNESQSVSLEGKFGLSHAFGLDWLKVPVHIERPERCDTFRAEDSMQELD
jgi:hypothetical protein